MDIYQFAKKEFEKHYDAKMTISINKPVKVGSIMKPKWEEELVNQPCRVDKKQLNPASNGEVSEFSHVIVLYCDPTIEIPAGCRISVTDANGNTRQYKRSSEGFNSHRTHQEIVIVREVKA